MTFPSVLLPLLVAGALAAADAPTPPAEPAPAADARSGGRALARGSIDGLRFGGIIGASVLGTLAIRPDWPVSPEISAGVGISGIKCAAGVRWGIGEPQWVIGRGEGPFRYDTEPSITPRFVAYRRWEDREREPDFWRGIVANDGWWVGGEVGLAVSGLALDVTVTWNEEHDEGPRWTLAYGLQF